MDRAESIDDSRLIVYATVGAGGDDLGRSIACVIGRVGDRSVTDDNSGRLLLLLIVIGSIIVNRSRNVVVDNRRWLLLLLRRLRLGCFVRSRWMSDKRKKVVSMYVSRGKNRAPQDNTNA